MNNRAIYSDNGSLQDFSVALDNFNQFEKVFNYKSGEDFLYIGTRLPFNNLYFKLNTFNTIANEMTIEYWDGNNWIECVEVIDETNGFNNSGSIQFTPDRDKSWSMQDTNYKGKVIPGLDDIIIYDRYWIRISFSEDFQGPEVDPATDPVTYENVTLDWCGNIFSNDHDLGAEYADLVTASSIAAYRPGNTDYQEQHAKAAKIIVQDLVNKRVIKEKGQILEWREFTEASVCKVAEIIFTTLGDDYADQKIEARDEYKDRINKENFIVDLNNNATEDPGEIGRPLGFLSR